VFWHAWRRRRFAWRRHRAASGDHLSHPYRSAHRCQSTVYSSRAPSWDAERIGLSARRNAHNVAPRRSHNPYTRDRISGIRTCADPGDIGQGMVASSRSLVCEFQFTCSPGKRAPRLFSSVNSQTGSGKASPEWHTRSKPAGCSRVRTSGRCSFRWPRGYDFRCAPTGFCAESRTTGQPHCLGLGGLRSPPTGRKSSDGLPFWTRQASCPYGASDRRI
jgi:hypothetical protein